MTPSNGPPRFSSVAIAVAIVLAIGLLIAIWPALSAIAGALVTTIADWRPVVGGAILIVLALLLVGVVRMVLATSRRLEHQASQAAIVRLAGELPADVRDVRDGHLIATLLARSLDQHYAAKLAEASRPFPQLHTFHQALHNQLPPPPNVQDVTAPALPPSVPPFAHLLDSGQIGPGRSLLLGYRADTGQPLTGSWADLYSAGVGGMTGSGKSWAIAFLAGQSAAAGARIILIDPHAGDSESLASRLSSLSASYMCDVASESRDIESALKLASSKLENRRAGRGGTWPILLICDEWTSMLRGGLGDTLIATALDYAEQGRKFGCFALLAAQAWQVDAASSVRDRLASHYILRSRSEQLRYQTGLRSGAAPEDTLTLAPGHAYFLTTRGDLTKVIIPHLTQADMLRLATLIDKPAQATGARFGFSLPPTQPLTPITAQADSNGTATGQQRDSNGAVLSTAAGSAQAVSAEAARAAALFLGGKDVPAIVQELRGIDPSKGGRRYREAAREINDLIRQALQRGNQ